MQNWSLSFHGLNKNVCTLLLSNFTPMSTESAAFMKTQKKMKLPSSMNGRKNPLLLLSFLNTETALSGDITKEEDIPRREKGIKTQHLLCRSVCWSKWSRLHCSTDLYAYVNVQIFLNQPSCCYLIIRFV